MSSTLEISPAPRVHGIVRVPGDKSISHRSVLFSGLAAGTTEIDGFLASEDCLSSLAAIQALGATAEVLESWPEREGRPGGPKRLRITGTGGVLRRAETPIDCGNSGTTMRLLAGILSGQGLTTTLLGDASLSRRPMNRVAMPLRQMGAELDGRGETCTAPLTIRGTADPQPIRYELPVASAQVKSAVLLCGLRAAGETTVVEPAPTRDHTERMLAQFGVELGCSGPGAITLRGPVRLSAPAQTLQVPADISSAAFWLVAAAARPGHELLLPRVGLNPTRSGVIAVLQRMGAAIGILDQGGAEGEAWGDLRVSGAELTGTVIAGREIPNVIDELPVLAVAGALARGVTEIRDARELRVKESDRISAVVEGLRAMGAQVEEHPDGMTIRGGQPLHGASIDSEGDHRIGMAFAIAGLFASTPTTILNAHHIATSYPGFATDLKKVTE